MRKRHYADTIRVWRGDRDNPDWARRYWHSFDAWEVQTAFYFKGDGEGLGETFRFKYDIPARRLSCFDAGCGSIGRAQNMYGELLPQEREM